MIYKVKTAIPDELYIEADTVEEAFNRAANIVSHAYFTCESKVERVSSEVVDAIPEDIEIFF